jgi:hypothetical protein
MRQSLCEKSFDRRNRLSHRPVTACFVVVGQAVPPANHKIRALFTQTLTHGAELPTNRPVTALVVLSQPVGRKVRCSLPPSMNPQGLKWSRDYQERSAPEFSHRHVKEGTAALRQSSFLGTATIGSGQRPVITPGVSLGTFRGNEMMFETSTNFTFLLQFLYRDADPFRLTIDQTTAWRRWS